MVAHFLVSLAIWNLAVLAPNAVGSNQDGRSDPRAPVTLSAVDTKWTDPADVVFLEHTGPYWTTGRLFRQVREHMVRHKQTGSMYARYPSDPGRVPASGTQVEIGFVADAKHEAGRPFKTARREGEFVAYTVVEGRAVSPRTDYPPILEWIETHGHKALGPIVEIYEPIEPGRNRLGRRTEIRVVLQPPDEPRTTPREHTTRKSAQPAPTRPTPEAQPGKVDTSQPTPQSHPPPDTRIAVAVAPDARTPQTEEKQTADIVAEEEAVQTAEQDSDAAQPVDQFTQDRKPRCEPGHPLGELVAAEQFDCVALELMPDNSSIPMEHQVWFGQVIFRVSAVAKGIRYVEPGGAVTVSALAEAIIRRYRNVSVAFAVDPLDQVAVSSHADRNTLAGEKRAIMRSLDTLMGRISVAGIDAADATRELVRALQEVQNLLRRIGIERSEQLGPFKQNQP